MAVAIEHLPLDLLVPSLSNDAMAQVPGAPYGGQGFDVGTGAMPGPNGMNSFPQNNYGPSSPARPTVATRPSSWPGGAAVQPPAQNGPTAPPPGPPVNSAPQKSAADPPYDPATILARVGTEVVQANEVLPNVHKMIAQIMKENAELFSQMPPDVKKEQLNKLERDAMKRSIEDSIRMKLLLSELRSKVPPEGLTKNEQTMRKNFNENQIKVLMATHKATSIVDLEDKLRLLGSSLEAQRTVYADQGLAISWLHQQVKHEPEPTHEEMLAYYREHPADWDVAARVRWEHLMVKFLNFDSKAEAYRAIARWGNDIQRGVPFAEVAKAHSQDFSADEGGRKDWSTRGSLRSSVLDDTLFSLPPGALSQILEDDDGFHIVRVIEREEAKKIPFTEVQDDIKNKLYDGNKEKHMLKYVDNLRQHVPVWTVFDNDPKPSEAGAASPAGR